MATIDGSAPAPRTQHWPAVLLLVGALALTVIAAFWVRAGLDRVARVEFDAACAEISLKIEEQVGEYSHLLRATAAFFSHAVHVDRDEWERYYQSLGMKEGYPGNRGLGYATIVGPGELARHERAVRAEGFPNYRVWPNAPRDFYTAIVDIEPFLGRNRLALGYDMFTEATRRQAMVRARDEAGAALSGKVTFLRDQPTDERAGVLMYYPVYRLGIPGATIEERRRNLQGWAYSSVNMEDLIGSLWGSLFREHSPPVDFRIYDGDMPRPEALLFDTASLHQAAAVPSPVVETLPLTIAGRRWTLEFYGLVAPVPSAPSGELALVIGSGTVISLLLFWLVLSLLNTRQHARRLAGKFSAELMALNADLESRVAERTRELEKATEAAEEANQAKSEFLSSMSHELRTPLNAILGFGQLLAMDSSLSPTQEDSIQEINRAGRHLLDLVNEVLDLSRIEAGRIDLAVETVLCEPVIDECLSLARALGTEKGLQIERRPGPKCAVRADRGRLKQVLLNLLSNAVKYNRDGGLVWVEVEPRGSTVRITVGDTGVGIPAHRRKELFTAFNRLGAEKTEVEGAGIGLTITRRLVTLMGGSIDVDSTEGRGSRFAVELPAADAPAEALRCTVLYVDDSGLNQRLVEQILGLRPAVSVRVASGLAQGLELVEAERPDLILIDLELPQTDSTKILRLVREVPGGESVPVVGITARASRDLARFRDAGFADVLTEPLDVPRFLQVIDRCLSTRGAHPPD